MNFLWDNILKFDKKHDVYETLRDNKLFHDLSILELKLVQNIVNVRTYKIGECLFKQGDTGVGMYIIMSGSVDITTEEAGTILKMQEGDFFGELALVQDNGTRTATAVALEETTVIGFFKPDLLEVINRNPGAGVKILMRLGQVLASRLIESTNQIKLLKKKGAGDM